jgi:Flp pilus assembly protein TadB
MALAGAAVVAGLLVAVSGLAKRPPAPPRQRRHTAGAVDPQRLGFAVAAGLATLVITRWPVAAVAAAVAVYVVTGNKTRTTPARAIERTDAIAMWAEMLRDATGTARGIEGILVATAPDAPEAIRPTVLRFARQLAYEDIEAALPDLADELDHEIGDLLVTALGIAARAGGRQIRAVLDDLAEAAREQAATLRRQEVARERPRSEMRQIAVLALVTVGALSLVARGYLEPYQSAAGQLVLVVVAGIWAAGFTAMARLARPEPVERFLAARRAEP